MTIEAWEKFLGRKFERVEGEVLPPVTAVKGPSTPEDLHREAGQLVLEWFPPPFALSLENNLRSRLRPNWDVRVLANLPGSQPGVLTVVVNCPQAKLSATTHFDVAEQVDSVETVIMRTMSCLSDGGHVGAAPFLEEHDD